MWVDHRLRGEWTKSGEIWTHLGSAHWARQWSGSRCGLYATSKGFETSPGLTPILMAPWAMPITTSQFSLMVLLKLPLYLTKSHPQSMENSQHVCRDGNLRAECIPLYVRVALFHGKPFRGKDIWWYFMLPGITIGECWAVLSWGKILRSCLTCYRSSWFQTAKDTDTEYLFVITIFLCILLS